MKMDRKLWNLIQIHSKNVTENESVKFVECSVILNCLSIKIWSRFSQVAVYYAMYFVFFDKYQKYKFSWAGRETSQDGVITMGKMWKKINAKKEVLLKLD